MSINVLSINVLSLFDGMSCGQIALQRAGISVKGYYASEVDKYAIAVTTKNYPDTVQLGCIKDIEIGNLPKIDLIMGGSPCQGFSFAGKQLNFDDPRSALFFEYIRLLKTCRRKNPNIKFLLENVKMKKESQDIITKYLGVKPIEINSALVSAQNRKRLYWTNIPFDPNVPDRGLLIENILVCNDYEIKDISSYAPYSTKNYVQFDISGKGHKSQQDRAYFLGSKFGAFPNARAITKRKIYLGKGKIRDLSLNECETLQNIPHNYTLLNHNFSLNKSLSTIGNGWTVDVIAHILKNLREATDDK